jgi:hypothetical protein
MAAFPHVVARTSSDVFQLLIAAAASSITARATNVKFPLRQSIACPAKIA